MFYRVVPDIDPRQPDAYIINAPYIEDPDTYYDRLRFERDNGFGKWNANRRQRASLVSTWHHGDVGVAEVSRMDDYFLYGDR